MCAKDLAGNDDSAVSEHAYAEMVARHAPDGVVISGPDRLALWVNPAFTTLTGYGIEDLRDKMAIDVLRGAETCRHHVQTISSACAQRRETQTELQLQARDGRVFWVDLKVTPIFDGAGVHTHFILNMRDITARKKLEDQNDQMRQAEELRQSERHLLALTSEWLYSAKSFDELLMVVQRAMHTLIPEADGALYIYGASRSTLDLATSWGTIPEFPAHMLPDECWALRRGRAYAYGLKPIQFACDHVAKPGTPFFCLPIIAHGETIGLLHIIFDGFEEEGLMRHMREDVLRNRWDVSLICAEQISLAIANVRLRQELHDKSMRDALTDLWNRRWFVERAMREFTMAEREGREIGLIMLDIDHFKAFNDKFGHDAGDLVLREAAGILTRTATEMMYPCRLGGEEFVVLCPNMPAQDVAAQADQIRAALQVLRLSHGGVGLPEVTASAGVAMFPENGRTLEEVLKAADQALYLAKDQGRNRTSTASCNDPG
ncbi:diguanylate cyclase [Roseinatronobacter alkalisoli]|uniref:diguanylate cyclase n=1 Tax=Roseinatronobacter alkalisoli TaxID=3028235 RepID=A0ABT5T3J4_9RHOB|nr:diguanylate cyclase [Roseinatronobacter sp. HJB301]MDD7969546.1 diguanylate cyclase [Roseinatronobacter sp. HJB301]